MKQCHKSSFLGNLASGSLGQHLLTGMLPLMKEKKFDKNVLIQSQGETQPDFYILKAGIVQVHSEVMYEDYNIKSHGPSLWNVTRTNRTIQVGDNVEIRQPGQLFAHSRIFEPEK